MKRRGFSSLLTNLFLSLFAPGIKRWRGNYGKNNGKERKNQRQKDREKETQIKMKTEIKGFIYSTSHLHFFIYIWRVLFFLFSLFPFQRAARKRGNHGKKDKKQGRQKGMWKLLLILSIFPSPVSFYFLCLYFSEPGIHRREGGIMKRKRERKIKCVKEI